MSYKDVNLLLTHQILTLGSAEKEDGAGGRRGKSGRRRSRGGTSEENAGAAAMETAAASTTSSSNRGEIMELRGGGEEEGEEQDALLDGSDSEGGEEGYRESHREAMRHLALNGGDYYEDAEDEDIIDTTMVYLTGSMEDVVFAGTRGSICPQVMAALSVSLGSMIIGFSTAYTSPALASMAREGSALKVTEQEESWIGGLMPLAALVGGVIGGPLIESFGRRNTIVGTAVPFIVSWLLIALAPNVGMVLGGRAVAGFCVGIGSLSLPVYLGETIQPEVRGTLGLLPTALGNIGILICFVVGSYLNWSQLAIFGAVLPIPFMICMFLIPETPRWYISKNKTKEARNALQWLRGKDTDISTEFQEIENSNAENKKCPIEPEDGTPHSRCSSVSVSSLFDLFSPSNARPLIISVGLMFFQQMSGINAVIFYTVTIFKEAGTSLDENLCTIVVGVVNFMSTFVATAFIDRLGRKVLLNVSGISMIVSLAALGGFFYAKDMEKSYIKAMTAALATNHSEMLEENTTVAAFTLNLTETTPNGTTIEVNNTSIGDLDLESSLASWSWLPLTAFVIYVVGFSIGYGPIPWLMMGEVLPAKIRGSAASLATAFNWSCTFIVTKTFRDLLSLLGAAAVFWLFGAFVIVGLVFVFFLVPETQGRSLEEIEMILTGRKKEVHIPAGYEKRVPVRRMSSIANLKPMPMGV